MKTAGPVHRNVALAAIKTCSTFHTTTSTDSAKFEQAIEDRTIIPHIKLALLFCKVVHIVRGNLLKEIDILVGVELGHLMLRRRFGALKRAVSESSEAVCENAWKRSSNLHRDAAQKCERKTNIDFHLLISAIVHNQAMSQPYAMRLHRMASHVGIVADIRIVEVCDLLLGTPRLENDRVERCK
jgi:hypothetical protein